MKNKGRVAMLMSGGVDSSVAATLLKEQGFEVIGFYILGWLGTAEFPCPWQQEESDARLVAEHLGIPFYTINLSKVYEREVINQFFTGYKQGVTPNPDILCNREIKFKAFWQAIRQFECDFIATGHYAKIEAGQIFKPRDTAKDQTYFLWGVDSSMLSKLIFPLGELTKTEVRALAKKYHLPTATKKDSQGICFVGPLKVRQFLQSRIKAKSGPVVLSDGREITRHTGVEYYTIGQRLAVGSVDWTGDVPPLFVLAKDLKNHRLIVGPDSQTFDQELVARAVNWLTDEPKGSFEAQVKIRYRQEDVLATISPEQNRLAISLDQPVRAITAGQSIVFYSRQGQLLGGAIIEIVPQQDEKIARLTQAIAKPKV